MISARNVITQFFEQKIMFIQQYFSRADIADTYLVQAQELLADITVLEVAVLKLEEQSSTLRTQLGQARIEREIAALKQSPGSTLKLRRQGSLLHPTFPDSIDFSEEIQPAPSPSKTPHTPKQPAKAVSHLSLASDEQFTPQESPQSRYGQDPQPRPPRKFWKVCV